LHAKNIREKKKESELNKIIFLIAISLLVTGCTQFANPPSSNNDENAAGGDLDMNLTIQNGDTITVNYRGTLSDGTEFDSSLKPGREPLGFTVGAGQMIAGFDEAVVGMKLNEEKTVTLPPAKAYGEERPDRFVSVPREALNQIPAEQIKIGTKLMTPNGPATITQIDSNSVTLNLNHELAGKTLTFWIKIVSIEKKK